MFGKQVFLGHSNTMGLREDSDQVGVAGFLPVHYTQYFTIVNWGEGAFLEQASFMKFLWVLGGSSKVLPESFKSWLFSAQNHPRARVVSLGAAFPEPQHSHKILQ